MQQHLELKCLLILVGNDNRSVQTSLLQGDAVNEVESVGPQATGLLIKRGRAETEIKLDVGVALAAVGLGLGGRLAEELPARVAGKAVLGQLRGSGVVGSGAEDLFV